jgi:acetylglutamate kinase
VGGAVLRDDLDALVSSLAFLQDVGLTPIVIHGAGPQLDAELSAAGIVKQTIDGLRVTSPEALAIVRRVFHAQNLKLVEALQASGCARHQHRLRRVRSRLPRPRALRPGR